MPPHSYGKASSCVCSRSVRARFGNEMLPRHASAASGPNQQRPRARKEGTTLKIPVRERMERTFVLPIDAHNPPTTAVIEKLDAVNSAHERLSVARVVT